MMDNDLRRLLDESAIRDLTAGYCDAVTHLDAARAASAFAEDGCVVIMGHETRGRAAIEQGMRDSFGHFALLQLIAHGARIEIGADRARARWSTVEIALRRGSDQQATIFGRYDDALVRTPSGWRFDRRIFTMAGRTQTPIAKWQVHDGFFATA